MSITDGLHVPVIPLDEVVGSDGATVPAQIVMDVPKLNVGVIFGLTVTTKFVGTAHCPASGVNLYVPEFRLSTTVGLHVPVTPFVDVNGREGTVPPLQILNAVPKENAGVTFCVTVTANVIELAHCPPVGVNVYVPVF